MLIQKAFKFRIYPNQEQQTALAVQFGQARFVYNMALAARQSHYQEQPNESIRRRVVACDRNSKMAAATAVGITKTGSMLGYNLGQMAAKTFDFNQIGQMTGTVSNAVLRVIDPTDPKARQKARSVVGVANTLINIGAWVTGVKPTLVVANKTVSVIGRVTGIGGNWLAALCKSGNAGTVEIKKRFLFLTFKQKVELTKSNALTSYLNRADVLPGAHVKNTRGTLFKVGKNTWHWGETTLHTSCGKHTITHLQTLALPSNHYYFDRPIAAKDMVELARGAKKPETIEGFAGSVSRTETLCTGWAYAKRNMILSKLHWLPPKMEDV